MTDGREEEVEELLLPARRALLEAPRAELDLIDRVLVERETSAEQRSYAGAKLGIRRHRAYEAPGSATGRGSRPLRATHISR